MSDFVSAADSLAKFMPDAADTLARDFIVESTHPEEELARFKSSQILAAMSSQKPGDVYQTEETQRDGLFRRLLDADPESPIGRHRDPLIKGLNTKTSSGFLEGVKTFGKDMYYEGRQGVILDQYSNITALLFMQDSFGRNSEETMERVRTLQREMGTDDTEFDFTDPEQIAEFFKPLNWVKGAVRMAPMMLASIGEAAAISLVGAGVGAGIGAWFSGVGAGPGAVAGFTATFVPALAQSVMRKETGLAYIEYLDAGMDKQMALAVSPIRGVLSAALEVVQVGALMKAVPGIRKLFLKNVDDILIKIVATSKGKALVATAFKFLVKNVQLAAFETGTETAQELVGLVGYTAGRILSDSPNMPKKDVMDWANQLVQIAGTSAGAMFVTGAGGNIIGGVSAYRAATILPLGAGKKSSGGAHGVSSEILANITAPVYEVKEQYEADYIRAQDMVSPLMRVNANPDNFMNDLEEEIAWRRSKLEGFAATYERAYRGETETMAAMVTEVRTLENAQSLMEVLLEDVSLKDLSDAELTTLQIVEAEIEAENEPSELTLEAPVVSTFGEEMTVLKAIETHLAEQGDKYSPGVKEVMENALSGMMANTDKTPAQFFLELDEKRVGIQNEILSKYDDAKDPDTDTTFNSIAKDLSVLYETLDKVELELMMGQKLFERTQLHVGGRNKRLAAERIAMENVTVLMARLASAQYKRTRSANYFFEQAVQSETPSLDFFDKKLRNKFRNVTDDEIDYSYAILQGIAEFAGTNLEDLSSKIRTVLRMDPDQSRTLLRDKEGNPISIGAQIVALVSKTKSNLYVLTATKDSKFSYLLHEYTHLLEFEARKKNDKDFGKLLLNFLHNPDIKFSSEDLATAFEVYIVGGRPNAKWFAQIQKAAVKAIDTELQIELEQIIKKVEKTYDIYAEFFDKVFQKKEFDFGKTMIKDVATLQEVELFAELGAFDPDVDYSDQKKAIAHMKKELTYNERRVNEFQRILDKMSTKELNDEKGRGARFDLAEAERRVDLYERGVAQVQTQEGYKAGFEMGKQSVYEKSRPGRIISGLKNRLKAYAQMLTRQINRPVAQDTEIRHRMLIEAIQDMFNPTARKNLDYIKRIDEIEEGMNFFEKLGTYDVLRKQIDEVTIKEMEDLRMTVDMLRTAGHHEFAVRKKKMKRASELVKQALVYGVLKGEEPFTGTTGDTIFERTRPAGIVKLVRKLEANFAMPDNIIDSLEGGQATYDGIVTKLFIKQMRTDKDVGWEISAGRVNYILGVYKELGIDIYDFKKKLKIGSRELTIGDWMGVYIASKDPDLYIRITSQEGNDIPETTVAILPDVLPEKYMTAAEAISDDFTANFTRTREAVLLHTGKDMGYKHMYMPVVTEGTIIEEIGLAGYMEDKSKGFAGFEDFFRFKRMGVGAIKLDLPLLHMDLVPKIEHYINTIETTEMMKDVIRDDRVQDAITQGRGKSWLDWMEKYINSYVNPSIYKNFNDITKAVSVIKKNTAIAHLAAKISIVALQAISSVFYLAKSGPKYYFAAGEMLRKDPQGTMDWIKSVDPYMARTVHDRTMLEFKTMTPNRFSNNYSKGQRSLMLGISWMDIGIKMHGWLSVYLMTMEGQNASEQVAIETARDAARDFTIRSQPSGDPITLPQIYRTNEFLNLALMYTNQPTKFFNMFFYEVPKLMGAKNAKQGWILLGSLMASSAMLYGIRKRKLPEDIMDWVELIFGGMINSIPFLGKQIIAAMNGYWDSSLPYWQIAKAPFKAYKAFKAENAESGFLELLNMAGLAFGGPSGGVKRVYRAISRRNFWELLGTMPEKEEKSQQKYELFGDR